MFQVCFKSASNVLQGCLKGVSRKFQEYFKGDKRMFKAFLKEVTGVCVVNISSMFQKSFKDVSIMF